jgi:heme/copper-type cytochrome/quinol oxidase subunit 3
MVILVASEATLFGAFIGTYFYLRFRTTPWPPDGSSKPALVVPLILLACLVATSFPMKAASRAARAGRLGATRFLLAVVLLVQAGYLAYEVHDFRRPDPSNTHHARRVHLDLLHAPRRRPRARSLAALFNLWLLVNARPRFTTYRLNAVEAITFYVLAVNVLTIVVFGTLLSARA